MPLAQILANFQADALQCEALITNAHMQLNGAFVLPPRDRQQITVAAFLNLFIGWESFLESSLADFMTGQPTLNGNQPTRYVTPPNAEIAKKIVIGAQRYFDYANHQYVLKIARLYFHNGYPYETHISGLNSDLDDLRTIRNSCAHISSTTQISLEGLAIRIFGQPKPGITVYDLLTAIYPNAIPAATVFETYRAKLVAAASLIANG